MEANLPAQTLGKTRRLTKQFCTLVKNSLMQRLNSILRPPKVKMKGTWFYTMIMLLQHSWSLHWIRWMFGCPSYSVMPLMPNVGSFALILLHFIQRFVCLWSPCIVILIGICSFLCVVKLIIINYMLFTASKYFGRSQFMATKEFKIWYFPEQS